jgi:hypothetical protein
MPEMDIFTNEVTNMEVLILYYFSRISQKHANILISSLYGSFHERLNKDL